MNVTRDDLKNVVLPCVALRKTYLHNKMLTATDDSELIRLKRCIEEFARFENFIAKEMKAEQSNLLDELNKL